MNPLQYAAKRAFDTVATALPIAAVLLLAGMMQTGSGTTRPDPQPWMFETPYAPNSQPFCVAPPDHFIEREAKLLSTSQGVGGSVGYALIND